MHLENLAQMFEALERQLGMYDVRIAEMDLRFQVKSYNTPVCHNLSIHIRVLSQ